MGAGESARGEWTEQDLLADVAAGPQGPRVGAFLDFDGTLIDGFSLAAFARHHLRSGHVTPTDLGRMLLVGMRGVTSEDDFDRFFLLGLRAWEGRSEDELGELGERLWRQGIAGSLYPEAWRLVAAHRAAGHTVVLASSATRFQVEPAARAMGVEHVLVTPVEFADGLCTGRAGGPPLWRAGKAEAVRAFAEAHELDPTSSYAYSNGTEDEAFLSTAGRARALNPEPGLASAAGEYGWPVVRFRPRGRRPGPREVVRTAAALGGTLGGFGAGLVLGGLTGGTRRASVDLGISLAGTLGTALGGVEVDLRGAEHLRARPAVFLFNHQSQLDVLVLAKVLRGGFTGVAKKELQRMPGFGAAFALADVAFVDRGDTGSARKALEPAVQRLRDGISLVIAPEGTRSATPALGPFKKGAFHVAMQAGVPLVPIVIHNAGELMWRGAATLREGTVRVQVLPPVPTEGWNVEALEGHVAAVRRSYLEALGQAPHTGAAVRVTTGPPGRDEPLEPTTGTGMDADAASVWRAESGGPRSTFTVLELLDRPPSPGRLAAAHEWASRMVPRMRQTVVEPALGIGAPAWTTPAHLDLARHLRHVRLPAPGSAAQLHEVVGAFAEAPLDRRLPLWGALLVEGLADGGAAYAVKIHRSVTDPTGAVRLLGLLHSRTAAHDPARPEPPAPLPDPPGTSLGLLAQEITRRGAEALAHPWESLAAAPVAVAGTLVRALTGPTPGGVLAGSGVAGSASRLLAGRGGRMRVHTVDVGYAELEAGARAAGGSVHDGVLAAVVAALARYHRALGVDVVAAGTTVGLGLPVGEAAVVDVVLTGDDPADLIGELREHVLTAGEGDGPPDVRVDALPGVGHTAYLAGARITRLHPLGPLAGCAAAVSVVRHDDRLCVAVVLDDAALTEPATFTAALEAALGDLRR